MKITDTEGKTEKLAPPYLPYKTFTSFIDGLRVSIPGNIDRSVMSRLSGTTQSMLIGTLRYFKLVKSDGTPEKMLEQLVHAEAGDRQKLMRDLLRAAYPFIFSGSINLQNASPKQIDEAFSSAGVSGDTVRKAVVFFLAAAKAADISLSPHLKFRQVRTPRRRSGVRMNGSRNQEQPRGEEQPPPQNTLQRTPYGMLIDILDPEKMDEEEQKAVWILIRYLKKQESEAGV